MATRRENGSHDEATVGAGPNVGALSYSDAGAELDAIIEEFETGVIDVDRLVEQLQRATAIVDELDRRLRRTRMQVEELVPRLEAIGQDEVTVVEVVEIDLDDEGDLEDDGDEAPAPGLF